MFDPMTAPLPDWAPRWPAEEDDEYIELFLDVREKIGCGLSNYLCPAIGLYDTVGAAYKAKASIEDAIKDHYTLDGWVADQLGLIEIDNDSLPREAMRAYRLRWIDAIIQAMEERHV